ncbi:Eukaryotic translation initiation factor 2 subunit 1 [Trichoplax sp. H2]|uniref:Eukaryotic translation initiation factor 2 subunit 1 n=1 Tax=Trichoplax adhaerens TaxID=10228 RepID=B3S196_TRIAD|nr:hypothetical protein TRIADDRAFT_27982 [Trichoplax adhaerens]EDV23203.1 hypothetical protein TRIADDRAFT_27982 [Trichoplax adhaerens]RDD43337.1 Eukaryotic translation initiation factor 2 subunit 1 [Trichoplax sp. H2]|eukprot:XP_002114113.1 hypothetical protein TRIADDRAFT_27982 [Trichoplax adhaerens]
MPLSCRYYSNKFPEVEDVVMVNVRSIAEMGAYVNLLEYNNIEGMILLSELSRRRIRSVNKLIRIGRNECVVVIRVDKEKGYIDLSKRRVSPEEVKKCEEKFAKAKVVNSILRNVAQSLNYETNEQLEELYTKSAWYFDERDKKPGVGYEYFKRAISDTSIVDQLDLDDDVKECLINHIARRLSPQKVKVRADIEVTCYTYEGVEAVKAALHAGLEKSTTEVPIKINLIAPPLYVVSAQTMDKTEGVKIVEDAIKAIELAIKQKEGQFNVQMAPKVVTETDDAELVKQMEQFERENLQIDGDDSPDED